MLSHSNAQGRYLHQRPRECSEIGISNAINSGITGLRDASPCRAFPSVVRPSIGPTGLTGTIRDTSTRSAKGQPVSERFEDGEGGALRMTTIHADRPVAGQQRRSRLNSGRTFGKPRTSGHIRNHRTLQPTKRPARSPFLDSIISLPGPAT
jgi:hypothetical protein